MPDEYKQIVLVRNGDRNLRFQGKEIASASTWKHYGPDQNRFTNLTVYQTKGGKYVLRNEYVTRWQGENGTSQADIYESIEDLMDSVIGNEEYLTEDGKPFIPNLAKELAEELNYNLDEEIE